MTIDVPSFENTRVLVAGDVMLDRYWYGATERISPEAPVPVVLINGAEERPGGAANVAVNVAALGARATVVGLVGDDNSADTLEASLQQFGVSCGLERAAGFPTVTKLRVLSRHQQLIRLDFEDGFPGLDGGTITERFTRALPEADVVVLSDYDKGALRDVQSMIRLARSAAKPVLVDPKQRDFSPYRGATLVTPNLAEFEAVVGRCPSEQAVIEKGYRLIDLLDLQALLVTRGEHGMSLFQRGKEPHHMQARARDVFDVTGAGDTVVAVLAAGMAAGMSLEAATQAANTAAGIVVSKLGAATVSIAELRRGLREQQVVTRGVVSESQLIEAATEARGRGETLVFTNGCFDILHAGHVRYLEQASRLGDRLIVAVNVDDTVRSLKGEGRPVNPLLQRMQVIAALGCVDWVVAFSEPTPERLICALLPDYLVKGGDNRPDQIPGADCVREAGGEVRVMDYVPGVSTTRMIDAIKTRS